MFSELKKMFSDLDRNLQFACKTAFTAAAAASIVTTLVAPEVAGGFASDLVKGYNETSAGGSLTPSHGTIPEDLGSDAGWFVNKVRHGYQTGFTKALQEASHRLKENPSPPTMKK